MDLNSVLLVLLGGVSAFTVLVLLNFFCENAKNKVLNIIDLDETRKLADDALIEDEHKSRLNEVLELLEDEASHDEIMYAIERTGLYSKIVDRWINLAELSRIQGLKSEYIELLVSGGITGINDLASRNPKDLYLLLSKINNEKQILTAPPSIAMITRWIRVANKISTETKTLSQLANPRKNR